MALTDDEAAPPAPTTRPCGCPTDAAEAGPCDHWLDDFSDEGTCDSCGHMFACHPDTRTPAA